jgi:uncharacterized membrane protein
MKCGPCSARGVAEKRRNGALGPSGHQAAPGLAVIPKDAGIGAATIDINQVGHGHVPCRSASAPGRRRSTPEWCVNQTSNPFKLARASEEGVFWALQRHCSVTPAQLGLTFGLLSAVSITVALFFWFQGAVLVLPFATLEMLALATAFVVHARHATDGERISVSGAHLVVEHEVAGHTQRCEFARDWVSVVPLDRGGLVEVCGGGRVVQVGRYLRSDLRPVLAREIRLALRGV